MSPQRRDPAIRQQLVDAAARVLADEGLPALTTRRLARETSRSTMAVYTHLGGMEQVQRAVRVDGFARLGRVLEQVAESADPVTDLAAASAAYVEFGIANPHLYRVMIVDRPLEQDDAGAATFEQIVTSVRRCVADGRTADVDRTTVVMWAAQLLSMRHGIVAMVLSGAVAEKHAWHVLFDMIVRLMTGYGDDPRGADQSVERVAQGRRS